MEKREEPDQPCTTIVVSENDKCDKRKNKGILVPVMVKFCGFGKCYQLSITDISLPKLVFWQRAYIYLYIAQYICAANMWRWQDNPACITGLPNSFPWLPLQQQQQLQCHYQYFFLKFNSILSNSCWDLSVWSEEVGWPHYHHQSHDASLAKNVHRPLLISNNLPDL